MALTNAERQRRYRQRRQAQQPPTPRRQPPQRRSRTRRWQEAVRTLRELQEEYETWLDSLPASLRETGMGEKLEQVCSLDLDELASVELPRGFGRD